MFRSGSHRLHVILPERQFAALEGLAAFAQMTTSELCRRALEHALSQSVVNEYLPTLSGRIVPSPLEGK